jgi:hypothetical protein
VGETPWRFESSQPHRSVVLMYDRTTVARALALSAEPGACFSAVSAELGIDRSTLRAWIAGRTPHSFGPDTCLVCQGTRHDFELLGADYGYLLGLYLGDGCISAHARDVFRLRVVLDARYPGIIESAREAMASVRGGTAAVLRRADRCVEVSSYWRSWPCLFPQHGPGKKHDRPIRLAGWQRKLAENRPDQLLRGLIESDGCRFQNTGRGGWSAARYSFSNRSSDIHGIFRLACEALGVRWTAAGDRTTYVSRKADVAKLDEFIGPKR